MIKKFVLIVGLLCSSVIFATDNFFGDDFGGDNSGLFDMVFGDDLLEENLETANQNIEPSMPTSTGSQHSSSSESTSSLQQTPYNLSPPPFAIYHEPTPPLAQQPMPAQPEHKFIELHEINGQLYGLIRGIGLFPAVMSPAMQKAAYIELNAHLNARMAQAHSTFSAPSPIAANSTGISTDNSIEEGGTGQNSGIGQNSGDDRPSRQPRGEKRDRPSSDKESSIQPQAQGVDPLDKHIATFFDAIIKCGFQNNGASKPQLNNGIWHMDITDLNVFVECVYQAKAQVKQAQKLRDRIKTIKGYFSSWPEDVSETNAFTATIKSTTKGRTNLSNRIILLLAKFTEITQQNKDQPEPNPKRRKTK